ncbi:hypothetical protein NPIRD3C_0958 [Nitrosopumilus piranensis]|uniref:Uncharacterized protein n=1 Tax=Nitrosopumilus piranensis TaxID=1582439 RepID=A0A0C5BYW1_9ARCH|nr:hypothetical protein NPIRD3C_0958 [Nitrosopumilus piranensis]
MIRGFGISNKVQYDHICGREELEVVQYQNWKRKNLPNLM